MYHIDYKKPIHIYFIGIGGISMSGLASILHDAGFRVSGSDRDKSKITETLIQAGIPVYYGQIDSHVPEDTDLVVYTAAIKKDHPDMIETASRKLPILTRAQLLGQIMKNYNIPVAISGTHGKTTTTSMLSEILLCGDYDPTLSIGGNLKNIKGNIRVGGNQIFVTEACEYTDSFLDFFPKIGIILNIEEDHLDYFKDISQIRDSFHKFAMLIPEDGTLVINANIENYKEITSGLKCQIRTFGTTESDYYASNVTYDSFARPSFELIAKGNPSGTFTLSIPGNHNILNALAAIAVSDILEVSKDVMKTALSTFTGSERRFDIKGVLGGVTIIDDYAHHPSEIRATLEALKNYPHHEIWCVFQPHTYTRTKAFLKEFAEALSLADHVILADIYAARENNTVHVSSKDIQDFLLQFGTDCTYFSTFDEIENHVLANCIADDLLITMGAGDIVKVGESLLGI